MYRRSAGIRGDVKEDDIRLPIRGRKRWEGEESVTQGLWHTGWVGVLVGLKTFFGLTESKSEHAGPVDEWLRLSSVDRRVLACRDQQV